MSHRSPLTMLASLATRAAIAAALVAGLAAPAAAQVVKGRFVRCVDTSWNSTGTCGGDNITFGTINIAAGGGMTVNVDNALADPFNLYELYWLPIGSAVTSAIYVGAFGTDCSGDYNGPLRSITTGVSVVSGPLTNFVTLVGAQSAGNFLIYSRGPWGFTDDGTCKPVTLNVVPLGGPATNPLANPTVTLGTSLVQFIPGYQ